MKISSDLPTPSGMKISSDLPTPSGMKISSDLPTPSYQVEKPPVLPFTPNIQLGQVPSLTTTPNYQVEKPPAIPVTPNIQLNPVPGFSVEGITGRQTGEPTLPTVSPITPTYNPETSMSPIASVTSSAADYSPPITAVPPSETATDLSKVVRYLAEIASNTKVDQTPQTINSWSIRRSTESEYQSLALVRGSQEQIVGG
jgi:hypothetical protein